MKLYYAPGACSIGIHVLLEEIGKPYQLEPVNLREGAQFKPPFASVTPKAKVPALERDDGSSDWLMIRGPGVIHLHLFERGRKYRISIEDEL